MDSFGWPLPFVVMALAMLACVVALFTLLGRNVSRARSPEGRAAVVEKAERWVSDEVRGLAPWGPGAITDLSTVVTYRWTSGVNEETRGVVEAVSADRPLLAFATVWGLSRRHILARTTVQR